MAQGETRRDEWHWDEVDPKWEVRGSGNPELTELVIAPHWQGALKQPLVARCGVLTGWLALPSGEFRPAIRMALDLLLSILELDTSRRPSSIRHAATPPPAPGALSLDELAEFMLNLFAAPALAVQSAGALLETGGSATGEVGAWIALSGVELERIVDLRGVRRVANAVGVGDHNRVEAWPLPETLERGIAIGNFVADFMDELLERGGYRDVKDRFDQVRTLGPTKLHDG